MRYLIISSSIRGNSSVSDTQAAEMSGIRPRKWGFHPDHEEDSTDREIESGLEETLLLFIDREIANCVKIDF